MSSPNITVQVKGGTTKVITGPTGGATKLVQLTDVNTAQLANGYVLTYSSANNRFEFGPQTGTGGGGGGDATVIAAQLSSNVNQFPANTFASAITYDSQDLLVNIGHTVGDSKVYVTSNGLYLIVTGIQVGRTLGGGEGPRSYDYWLRQNGVDVPNSTVRAGLREVADTIVLVDNFVLQLVTGDYVEVVQAVEQAGLGMGAFRLTALAGGPTVPSIIFTMLRIASGANAEPNVFSTISVAGQSNVVADSNNDTLTLVAGTGMVITTDAPNDTITFVSTGSADQFARDQANAAFNQANTANVTGQAAFNQANTDFIIATSAYSQANIATSNADAAFARANAAYSNANTAIYTAAQIRANLSNTAPVNYDPSTGIISHALSGVVATTYGNTTFVPTITVDDKGHVTSITNTAIALPPSTDEFARAQANAAYNQANTANVTGQAAFDRANAGFTLATTANTVAASAYNQANIATSNADAAFARANAAYSNANTAIYTAAQIRANISNTAPINYSSVTGDISHALSGAAASGYGDAATVPKVVVDDKGHVTSVVNTAIAISAAAITSGTLAVARGGTGQTAITVNGSLLIGNTVSGGYDVNPLTQGTGIVITNDKGSITIAATGGSAIDQFARDHGNGAFDKANSAIYTAAQIRANISNTTPILYDPTTGIISLTTVPVSLGGTGQTAITVNGSLLIGNTVSGGYDVNALTQGTGIVITNDKGSITIAATGGSALDQYARDKANGAAQNAFVTLNVAGQSDIVADSNTDTLTIVGSGITITTNAGTDTLTIQHPASGVVASGYGDAATVPKFVVDANGHMTSVTNTAIAISAAAITSGILQVARGGTGKDATGLANGQLLIGNTVNTGFDLNTIAQTAPVIVTNGKGTITLSHASSGVVATGYGSPTQIPVFVVDTFGHVTTVTNTAITGLDAGVITTGTLVVARGGTGQSSYTNGQILIGNTGSTGLDKATIAQSAPVIVTNLQGSITISHARSGVVAVDSYGSSAIIPVLAIDANGHITAAVNTAVAISAAAITSGILQVARGGTGKDATGLANGQLLIGNTVNTGFDLTTIAQTAPVIVTNGKGTITLSHASSGVVATGYGTATQIPVFVVDAFGHITSVTNTAIAGLDAGVITTGTLVVARGGTGQSSYTNGQILIGNTGSTGLDKATIAQSAPVIVTNLQGSITISHARSGVVAVDSYGSSAIIPVLAIDANGHITAAVNTAVAISAAAITSGILTVARGGTGKDATGLVNGSLHIGNTVNTGFDLTTIAQTAPVIVTNGKGTITLSHASSGVVATGYGTASQIPVFVVDAFGHITSVTNTAIAGLDAGVITTGTLVVARGGTGQSSYTNGQILIGNTGSTGLDKAVIAQSAPVIVTNLQGSITISHARSGVVAVDSYGSSAIIPVLAIDANGHITAAVNTAVAISAAAITSGTLVQGRGGTGFTGSTANGQTLIGNTVSGGFDLATLTAGSGININNLKGSIEIVATGGSATDQFARDTANGAFTKANGAVQTGFVTFNVARYNVGAYRDVVADSNTDIITLVGGRGVILRTNANSDTLTINTTSDLQVSMESAVIATNTWTNRVASANSWQSIVWSPELAIFVAVNSDGGATPVMTSPDGITWTTRTAPLDSWKDLAWSPELGLFAAVSTVGTTIGVMTSSNGIVWTTRTTPANSWSAITWSPELGLFVAVNSDGTTQGVATSANGITWTSRTTPVAVWTTIGWSPELGIFTALNNGSGTSMYSTDGVVWTAGTASPNAYTGMAWSSELKLFAATYSDGVGGVITSPNGITWTNKVVPLNAWEGIAWSPALGIFAAVNDGGVGGSVMTSKKMGIYATIAQASVNRQTLINLGTTANDTWSIAVTDAGVTDTSIIIGSMAYKAAGTKELDECDMDSFNLQFGAANGSVTVFITSLQGYVVGEFYLNYSVHTL